MGEYTLLKPPTPGQLHIWRMDLTQFTATATAWATLDAGERTRAARFLYDRDREWYVLRHFLLRLLAGRYLALSPVDVRFAAGRYGKPSFLGGTELRFNMSHRRGRALCAFSVAVEIGVDLEYVDSGADTASVSDAFFSPAERTLLSSLASPLRTEAFYRLWTCKEALLKARGEGLSSGLQPVDMGIDGNGNPQLDAFQAAGWNVHELRPWPAYLGAVAAESPSSAPDIFDVPSDLSQQ